MHIRFTTNKIVQIDDARIIYRNFAGIGSKFNRDGDRNFSIVIPDQEAADALMNDVNEYGVGWNVRIKPPREEGDVPFMHLPVKIKFNGRGPKIYLRSGDRTVELTEETVACLDDIDIASVDIDIRPYDDEFNGKGFRSAYLQALHVTQEIDRFAARAQAVSEGSEV